MLKYEKAQEIIYNKYSESFKIYLEQNVRQDLEKLKGTELLAMLIKKWQNHEIMVKWMKSFF